ncbi:FaeA/PapI family transcriptional regulator [[Mycobacterium] burgundiense]|uniref:FaeA/PapI family transcriptional regulator n=1 Tax=[Mycobacterium] burgundiense TaxID=3064286 RepID=A0ABN9MZ88_9MYCO|nr:FaeA/PapI family transcriptional regulator [Mycolicibacterium sp. MU0053]CAJ1497708.1 FaeA/PapI family transcriptional regulator [Mycolicibacterium sp. MU0053]
MTTPSHDTSRPASERAAGQQRGRVLELVRSSGEPVDARQVADALAIHVTTARFHLGTLESQGAIRRGAGTRGGRAGRPRLTYELAPRLGYAEIVALFATHLGGTVAEREERATRIGADLARRVRLARTRPTTSVTDLVVAALEELGFQTRSVVDAFGEVTVGICTCPLAEIAVDAPEVVRGIQQGLIQEVVDVNAATLGRGYRVSVDPDPRAGSCEVRLVLRAEPGL